LLPELSRNFNVISLDTLVRGELSPSKLNILCTFDDGYKNNLTLATPLCEKHHIPFTIFCNDVPYHLMDLIDICHYHQPEMLQKLISHFNIRTTVNDVKNYCKNLNGPEVQKYSEFLFENLRPEILEKSKSFWEVLTDEDLRLLAKNELVSFGNHGALHLIYQTLSDDELAEDLKGVANRFARLNISVDAFAYPYGTYSASSISLIKKNGYKFLLSGDPNEKHPELMGRLTINPFISVQNQLIAIAKGHY
jgi:peptidoglycan/xylan/chitin deacetylase (PgdA/CDA1 family)